MKNIFILYILSFFTFSLNAQVNTKYKISFKDAVHHEAVIEVNFKNIKSDTANFRMSRSSPGRYALHEFAKNVYNVKVTDANGNILETMRTDPYSWQVLGHKGEINVSYRLFANHGDGTYSQIDETHAHLNMPATFMFMPELSKDEIEITFVPREDLNWKIATQLKNKTGYTFYAKDLQYFMDSPTELSYHKLRSYKVEENGKTKTIKFALHDNEATDQDFDAYFVNVEKIVRQQQAIYGELPNFDYDEYTFLACYMPQVTGDGMEHRNSTVLTTTRSIHGTGASSNLGTVSHEFFHCWNVERIRPKSLEPFDFTEANMSGELWFAEGFTSYYDGLSMKRAGLISDEDYLKSIENGFNFVWNSPGRQVFGPIEMSYQAPFVDAAKSVDETNRENTFISYYSYGDMLGLALDVMLRNKEKSLDIYMRRVWENFGKTQKPYTIKNLQATLAEVTDQAFADNFFNNFIFKGNMPDVISLFNNLGVQIKETEVANMGAFIRGNEITSNPKIGSSLYDAGLQKGDKILSYNETTLSESINVNTLAQAERVGDSLKIVVERFGSPKELNAIMKSIPQYKFEFIADEDLSEEQKKMKSAWLDSKINTK